VNCEVVVKLMIGQCFFHWKTLWRKKETYTKIQKPNSCRTVWLV